MGTVGTSVCAPLGALIPMCNALLFGLIESGGGSRPVEQGALATRWHGSDHIHTYTITFVLEIGQLLNASGP